ncbi:MAG: TetR/AcrR family transcriptional regulator [Zoogloea sp.]|nr:MAG: TetR/AcrR family transcriptional regulator [Zoogloea sp.]
MYGPAQDDSLRSMTAPTRSQVLAEAEYLIRRSGYSAFSYAHLTDKIGITKASIHYHFPTKQRLAEEVVEVAMARFATALAGIEAEQGDAPARLQRYGELFLDGFEEQLRPLCCALSAELAALPDSIHARTRAYFELHLAWLTRIVEAGVAAGQLCWADGAGALATLILSTLEGGSLVARAMQSRALALAGFAQVLALAAPPAGGDT